MKAISISYRNADVSVRERFAFDESGYSDITEKLGKSVILCTCNRTELYFTGRPVREAVKFLAEISGMDNITEYIRIYEDVKAMRHLFRVACGIDSMVIGEDEILRQVKEAYAEACKRESTDFTLNTVFQAAVACAKRIKTETALSVTPVSAATIAANEAAHLGDNVNVLMIGASGKIGSATLKNLLPHKNVHITQTARSHTAGDVHFDNVRTVPYDRRYEFMDEADCIISATSSPHFTVTAKKLAAALKTAKPRLFIDLAVPPDIERSDAAAGARFIGIDDIGALAKHNNELKMSAAEQAEFIINEEIDELQKKLAFHAFLPKLDTARKAASELSFDGLLYKLRDRLNSEQFCAVLDVLGDPEEK